ncbi:hypothetical protein [Chryseobacterium sp.]|uniref:hypothetical protein n=1 Tax=Chryseobacterium sp. TaxID=1871047 RepID=UPI00261993FA|nr:hypothetical protein [Chryseobacterium sp.]
MPIRTKIVPYCYWTPSPNPSEICVDQIIPIRDWIITPGQLHKIWTQGTSVSPLFQDITFPELEFVYSYAPDKIKFKIRKVNSGAIDWLKIHSTNFGDNQEFKIGSNPVVRFYYDFTNLDNLPITTHSIDIFYDAFGIDEGKEVYLESYNTPITITVKAGTGISTDKNAYSIVFNKATNTLSGDDKIVIYSNDFVVFNASENFLKFDQSVHPDQSWLTFLNNPDLQNKPVGNYSGNVNLIQNSHTRNVTVNVEVINDATEFDVSPKSFSLTLEKNPVSSKILTANISNPNNLTISILLKPSFISEATITNNVLSFKTENSSNLAIGNYTGKIILKAGLKTKEIAISINVIKSVEHDFKNSLYYFAEDPNKVTIFKVNSGATYVKMKLEMYFKGYGEESSEIQEGSIPFFQGKTEFFPGEEIQDFFIRCKNFKDTSEIQYLMNLAAVKITFSEMNDKDEELSSFVLSNLLFAPGKKPLCFPVLTNYPVRRTFPKSEIKLPIDRLSSKNEIQSLKMIYLDNINPEPPNTCIDLYTFKRDRFQPGYDKKIIVAGEIQFIPVPERRDLIHILWENSNQVFEWFSAPLEFKSKDEIENVFAETSEYEEEKTDSKISTFLTVNSGILLKEEVPMLTDMLESKVCYLKFKDKTIRAYPVGTTNELYESKSNPLQMDLEFKVFKTS